MQHWILRKPCRRITNVIWKLLRLMDESRNPGLSVLVRPGPLLRQLVSCTYCGPKFSHITVQHPFPDRCTVALNINSSHSPIQNTSSHNQPTGLPTLISVQSIHVEALLIRYYPCSSICIFLITNYQPLFRYASPHQSCGISFLIHSVNLILFILILVNLILHISPRHSPCWNC